MSNLDPAFDALVNAISREDFRPGEVEIISPNEKLWRQVHENNLVMAVVSESAFLEVVDPAAFAGTPSARYEVSTCMESAVDAEQAHKHYTKTHSSAGTFEVSVEQVSNAFARAVDDSTLQTGSDPIVGHAYIDLRGMHKTLQRRARSELADAATKAKRIYPPP
ncbi:hypothetical protein [Arthrobacter glacialis]|uniref:hypothetical protein n=1 Tax=Arthrobacter glacialis TaxID=1664 RepID=UPI000CD42EDC|nr:hypothetical protein [Arthrobacter glacialis]POH58281.1 hypothetical protein CVS28_12625 [Arthrobacter glacialis]